MVTEEQVDTAQDTQDPPTIFTQAHSGSLNHTQVPSHLQELYQQSAGGCDDQQKSKLADLLSKYASVFSASSTDVGRTDLVQHSIPTLPNTAPIKQPPRRLGVEKDAEVERQVQELLEKGMIEPADGA